MHSAHQCHERHSATPEFTMADQAPSAAPARVEGESSAQGNHDSGPSQSHSRGRGGGNSQRGGRGKKDGRAGQTRDGAKGFGSNQKGGRQKKGEMGRGEY